MKTIQTIKTDWTFVIDTEEYAGNFYQQMMAFVTGSFCQEGEKGYKEAKQFIEDCGEEKFEEIEALLEDRICEPGDDGIHYSNSYICPTPGWYNNGKGEYFVDDGKNHPLKFDAYLSVAIFFSEKPTEELMTFLADRVKKFSFFPKTDSFDVRPSISGCRLLCTKTEVTETIEWTSEGNKSAV